MGGWVWDVDAVPAQRAQQMVCDMLDSPFGRTRVVYQDRAGNEGSEVGAQNVVRIRRIGQQQMDICEEGSGCRWNIGSRGVEGSQQAAVVVENSVRAGQTHGGRVAYQMEGEVGKSGA